MWSFAPLKPVYQKKGKAMNLAVSRKHKTHRQKEELQPSLFVLNHTEPFDLAYRNLNKNLFQLEKDMAFFRFAIQEIRDISSK